MILELFLYFCVIINLFGLFVNTIIYISENTHYNIEIPRTGKIPSIKNQPVKQYSYKKINRIHQP